MNIKSQENSFCPNVKKGEATELGCWAIPFINGVYCNHAAKSLIIGINDLQNQRKTNELQRYNNNGRRLVVVFGQPYCTESI